MAGALLTTYLSDYRVPLYETLAERHGIEVLCYGGGDRYVGPWFADLDGQIKRARFPARRMHGRREAMAIGRHYDVIIAPFAGGAILPAAYLSARRHGRRFVLWASVWSQPRSLAHALALPLTRRIYRDADAVVAYGEHVRRFVARIRGRDEDVFVAPQAVEPLLFARSVSAGEAATFRTRYGLGDGPLVLYVGRLVAEKGVGVLAEAWLDAKADATLVAIGDGPLAGLLRALPRTRLLGPIPRRELPAAYATASMAVLASVPTPRFLEPWGLVCNEALHQGCPMLATPAVGAVAGGLVRHGESGWLVPSGSPEMLASGILRLLGDRDLRERLAEGGRRAVAPYTYEAMADAFERALAVAAARHGGSG